MMFNLGFLIDFLSDIELKKTLHMFSLIPIRSVYSDIRYIQDYFIERSNDENNILYNFIISVKTLTHFVHMFVFLYVQRIHAKRTIINVKSSIFRCKIEKKNNTHHGICIDSAKSNTLFCTMHCYLIWVAN